MLFARHPELRGRSIKRGEHGLRREWNKIRKGLLRPSPAGKATAFDIDLGLPEGIPTPDFSQTEDQLGAWEKARFEGRLRFKVSTAETAVKGGKPGSYVSLLGISFDNPRFQVSIARHLRDNAKDATKQTRERNQWGRILFLIRTHAFSHLDIFRNAARNLEAVFKELFKQFPVPTAKKPWAIPKEDLDTYLNSVGKFLGAVVEREFWEKTCEWEKKDYPVLTKTLSSLDVFLPQGLQVNCGPKPKSPDVPLPPAPN